MSLNLEDDEEEDVNDYDVVIVGAGLTGLSTAYNILRRKPSLNVLVVEGTSNDSLFFSYCQSKQRISFLTNANSSS